NYLLQPFIRNIVGRGEQSPDGQPIAHGSRKAPHCHAATPCYAACADLADASGGALSAGVPGGACPREDVSRVVLYAGARSGGDAAADPALSVGCCHHLLGYPGGPPCVGSEGVLRGRAGAGPGAGSLAG